jgi:long-chain acyl-CoA synthetase
MTGLHREKPTAPTNVTDFLLAGKTPDRVALRLVHGEHTYGELQRITETIARHLVETGGRKGDRVILLSENSFFWVAAYLGALRAGLVCVPLPTGVAPDELDYILEITEPNFAFLQTAVAATYRDRFHRIPILTDTDAPRLPNAPTPIPRTTHPVHASGSATPLPEVCPSDLAALMFTSGSTGRPRGVMVSHANIMANTESIIRYLDLIEDDRIMAVLPFHYCFGTSLLHTHLRVGASLVVGSSFMYPEAMLQRMIETECTGFAGVPSHFQILLRNSSVRNKQFPHLRYLQQAGGHLAPGFIQELRKALPNTRLFIMYGQTEATSRLSYLPPKLLEQKLGSIGKGIPGVTLRVLDESGGEVGPGDVGEIVAVGENVAQGYWRDPTESAISFRNRSLHTGDLGTTDQDGFIYIVGRAKDFVKCGGKRVSCRQLEERLLEFEGLLEAAVVGIPDDILGEAVKAFVVPRRPESSGFAGQVLQFCKHRLPPDLVPHDIVVLDALPKNSAGKVLKQRLKDL